MTLFGRYRSLREFLASPMGPAVGLAVAVGGYYAWTRHQVHVVEALPYLLLGGCMLMHLFMHRGHGHGHAGESDAGHDEDRHDPKP